MKFRLEISKISGYGYWLAWRGRRPNLSRGFGWCLPWLGREVLGAPKEGQELTIEISKAILQQSVTNSGLAIRKKKRRESLDSRPRV